MPFLLSIIKSTRTLSIFHSWGSGRFKRLWDSAVEGKDGPPADLRYLKRPKALLAGDTSPARVSSYLQSVYESVAETLPDVKDDGITTEWKEAKLLEGDGYAPKVVMETENHRKKMRKRKMSLQLHPQRHPDVSKQEVRFLPPGTMKEYFDTMKGLDGREGVSFKTFWQTWNVEYPHLKFRPTTTHSQCATCLKHKLMVRSLANHCLARQKQNELLAAHLLHQYEDRQVYWALRGQSRLRCVTNLVLIVDGMDQAKFVYPRSSLVMNSKELASFQRPRLQVTGCIIHGHALMFVVSGFDHPKDSSASAEVITHALTVVHKSGVPLHNCHVHVQADNTSREVKNNTILRLLAALTSHRSVAITYFVLESFFYAFVFLHGRCQGQRVATALSCPHQASLQQPLCTTSGQGIHMKMWTRCLAA